MPFYEYQCKNCGHTLEAMQKVNDSPLRKCPECGKSQLTRLMSAPVFRLKGGGWYETDFKGDSDHKRNLADRPEADASKDVKAATDTAETTKEPAKPADKPADKPAEKSAAAEAPKKSVGPGPSKRGAAAKPAPIPKSAAKPAPKVASKRAKPKSAVKAKGRR
jgi:putative FmdB family regulatory protein